MADIFNLTDTWNNGATTFTAVKMNVIDTASNAASLLMDLQVAGSSKFNVSKTGKLTLPWGNMDNASGDLAINNPSGNNVYLTAGGNSIATAFKNGGFVILNSRQLSFSSSGSSVGVDVNLYRDAANTLGQRNSTNAQTFNIYNTYTDASNYELGGFRWNSNILEIRTAAAGTGTVRALSLTPAAINMPNLPTSDPGVSGRLWNNGGVLTVSAG